MTASKPHSRVERVKHYFDLILASRDNGRFEEAQEYERNVVSIVSELEEQFDAAMDCMNYAWTIICNVSEGNWTKQQQEWQDAAARCRDQYHALLASNPASSRQTVDPSRWSDACPACKGYPDQAHTCYLLASDPAMRQEDD